MISPDNIKIANEIIWKFSFDFMFSDPNSYISGKTFLIDPIELNQRRNRLIRLLEEQNLF